MRKIPNLLFSDSIFFVKSSNGIAFEKLLYLGLETLVLWAGIAGATVSLIFFWSVLLFARGWEPFLIRFPQFLLH